MPEIIVLEEQCKGCELCVDACPKGIIALDGKKINNKGYHPARLTDKGKCTGCASCAVMCPDVAIRVIK
jgi:2-oxoglutarate ferredoxin oxidoreductase subunit delta